MTLSIELIATSTFGLESVVAEEVAKLGYTVLSIENGKVTYKTDALGICRSNLWLRTAERVRLKVGEFRVETFDNLFEQTKALPWEEYLPRDACFPVDGKSIKSKLFSVSDCQAIVKKAIVERLKQKYAVNWFEETGSKYPIEVALLRDVATITLDTSGAGLHKRGYRFQATTAPLKETLAAALVDLAKWHPQTPLVDPLCGSGTIPVEAALRGLNIAPGINRQFISEQWPSVAKDLWLTARTEATDLRKQGSTLDIVGTDCDPKAIALARHNARLAGVLEHIHFQVQPMNNFSTTKKYGKIICNPPYGERLGEKEQVENLYRDMGLLFSGLKSWSFYAISSNPRFEQLFGKKADKKRKLYNGDIKVDYYQYFGPRLPKDYFHPEESIQPEQ